MIRKLAAREGLIRAEVVAWEVQRIVDGIIRWEERRGKEASWKFFLVSVGFHEEALLRLSSSHLESKFLSQINKVDYLLLGRCCYLCRG